MKKTKAIEGFFSPEEGETLVRYALQVKGVLVEIGSYKGLSTAYLARAADDLGTLVYAIDPHFPYTDPHPGGATWSAKDNIEFLQNVAEYGDVLRIVNLHSFHVVQGWNEPIGLLFVDGSHVYADAKRDIDQWTPYLVPDGYLALHDTRSIADVKRLFNELLNSGAWELVEQLGELAVLKRA